jgi:ABC-type sugar transport system ATPase subunit
MSADDRTIAPAATVLQVRGASIRFGGVEALRNVDFEVRPGEVVALAGDNGAGKSTLIKVISGVYVPGSGEVRFLDELAPAGDPQGVRTRGIETIYQDLALADNLDVGSNIFLGREPMKRLLGIPVIDRARMAAVAREVLDRLDIHIPEKKLTGPVRMLSGGQRQAIAIGRAIYWNAKLLIMDEPTAALGVPEQRKVMALIRALRSQGVAVILVSHNLHDIFGVADRIVVMRRGEIAGERATRATDGDEIVRMMVGDTYAETRHAGAAT